MPVRILQIIEIIEEIPHNVLDIRTGQPIVFEPPEEVEFVFHRTACIVCGKPFWWARRAGERGRLRRFCSDACHAVQHLAQVRGCRHRARTAGMDDLFAEAGGGSNL